MAVLKSSVYTDSDLTSSSNYAFYTADGMRFDFSTAIYHHYNFPLYESNGAADPGDPTDDLGLLPGNCGSMGLAHNPDGTTKPPCVITVDVNGDRKPSYVNCTSTSHYHDGAEQLLTNCYSISKLADPNGRLLSDIFSVLITDQGAIPYGVVAQKAMYQAQK